MARCVARNPKEIVRQVAAAKELDSAKCSGSMAPVDLEHGKSALGSPSIRAFVAKSVLTRITRYWMQINE